MRLTNVSVLFWYFLEDFSSVAATLFSTHQTSNLPQRSPPKSITACPLHLHCTGPMTNTWYELDTKWKNTVFQFYFFFFSHYSWSRYVLISVCLLCVGRSVLVKVKLNQSVQHSEVQHWRKKSKMLPFTTGFSVSTHSFCTLSICAALANDIIVIRELPT